MASDTSAAPSRAASGSTPRTTAATTARTTSRAQRREETYAAIVRVGMELLTGGKELSLRSVAAGLELTPPALYRYVASYQELVDLIAFEIDRGATAQFRAAADRHPADDPLARLLAAAVAFRAWALANPRHFSLVFANPVADSSCVRRDLLTVATSGHFMNGLLWDLHEAHPLPHPHLDDLDPAVVESLRDPVMPMDTSRVPDDERGVLWVFVQAWSSLYGTVALEVFGHVDPRLIESGAVFAAMVQDWLRRLDLDDQADRVRRLLATEIAAG